MEFCLANKIWKRCCKYRRK